MSWKHLMNTPITGVLTYGTRNMNDIDKFCWHYRARAEVTDQNVYESVPGVVQVGTQTIGTFGPAQVTTEKVICLHLPKSEFDKLVKDNVDRMNEETLRNNDQRLYKLYMEYKLWLEMIR